MQKRHDKTSSKDAGDANTDAADSSTNGSVSFVSSQLVFGMSHILITFILTLQLSGQGISNRMGWILFPKRVIRVIVGKGSGKNLLVLSGAKLMIHSLRRVEDLRLEKELRLPIVRVV